MFIRSISAYAVAVSLVLLTDAKKDLRRYSSSDLPETVQNALEVLDDGGLILMAQAALSSIDIYENIVIYITQTWNDTNCDWLNDNLPGSVRNGFQYDSSAEVITGPLVVFCDIEQTFDPFCVECLDASSIPESLYNQLVWLSSNGHSCLARIKYNAYEQYSVVWNDEFLSSLGLQSENELFRGFGQVILSIYGSDFNGDGVYKHKKAKQNAKSHRNRGSITSIQRETGGNPQPQCSIPDPVDLVTPNLWAVLSVLEQIFNESDVIGTTATLVGSFGIQICAAYETEICIGEAFGFAVDAIGGGFIFEESTLEIDQITNTDEVPPDPEHTTFYAKFTIEFSFYDAIDNVYGTELSRQVTEELGEWITAPAIIYTEDGEAVGVTFAGEVYISEGNIDVSSAVPLGAITIDRIAELVAQGTEFGFAVNTMSLQSNVSSHSIVWYSVMTFVLVSLLLLGIKFHSKATMKHEYQPLI